MERIPILKMGSFLLVTIQVDMHDRLATALEEDLTSKIVDYSAKGVLIDISALEIVDSFIGRMLDNIAAVSRVLDADDPDYVAPRMARHGESAPRGLSSPRVPASPAAERDGSQ